MRKLNFAYQAAALLLAMPVISQPANIGEYRLKADGALNVQSFSMPFSAYASAEARTDASAKFERMRQLGTASPPAGTKDPVAARRTLVDQVLFAPWLEAQRHRYAVTMTEQSIDGVRVQVFTPKSGVKADNVGRVLINLHGGGFMIGWPLVSQIESIPIAAVGGIKVISVDYRMAPEARFPAASEDVAAVYRELLKTHKPSEIGFYGCSAGGILTSQSMAWFQKMRLPMPAAIAILSAAVDPKLAGDSAYFTPQLGSYIPRPGPSGEMDAPYFAGADFNDPLVSPSRSKAVLSRYPPTLLVSGTRAGDMSAETHSHLDLLSAGVKSQLLLWDGLDHCFMYNPDMPESRQAYAMINDFFKEHLGRPTPLH